MFVRLVDFLSYAFMNVFVMLDFVENIVVLNQSSKGSKSNVDNLSVRIDIESLYVNKDDNIHK